MNKVALYARVSTDDKNQNPETQLHALRLHCKDAGYQVYREYTDQARAKDYLKRKAWQQLQKDARQRKFKTILVFKLDRAFRSVRECVNLVEDWHERGIAFKSLRDDVIDTTTSQGRFVMHVMAAMAELESSTIGDRVKAGMARAQADGTKLGRKLLGINVKRIYDVLRVAATVQGAADELGCSRSYVYQELAKYGTTPLDVINGRWKPSS